MNRKNAVIAAALMLAALLMVGGCSKADPPMPGASKPAMSLKIAMRGLWDAHTTWTRLYIVSAVAGLPDADKVAARLLKNQDDIGNAVKPFYGDAAGNKLAELLRMHIQIAAAVVSAAKAGNTAEVDVQSKKWSANADDIADFLSKANPNWTKKALQDMLYMHLKLTTQEAVDQLQKNYDASIADYDKIHEQAMMMADDLSDGIIKQFPEKFKK
jgi:hypothetical protein